MIDISTEHLIPIGEVPKHLPARHSGKHIHISAVYRWLLRGIRGAHLESIRIGGTSYTSTEALQRFADQLSHACSPSTPTQNSSTTQRRSQIERATRQLAVLLGQSVSGALAREPFRKSRT